MMATTIKLKNGSGVPLAGDLVQGEPALDLTNKRLYSEDSGGTVIEIGTTPTSLNTTGTVTFGSLSDGSITVTAFVDEDNMASDSATLIPTQQSVKAYVDSQVALGDTLAELTDTNITTPADGALLFYDTGTSTWIDNVVSGDVTIADTGVAAIGSGVIVNDDVNASAAISVSKTALVDGTGLTLTGDTLSVDASQTQITAVGTIATGTWQGTAIADAYVANDLTISGGTVDNSVIGGTTAAAGTFTTFTSTGIDDNATSTAITIDSSENVGIGTTSPDESLVVQGGIKIRGTNKLSFTNTSDQTYITAAASNVLAFGTDSTERMRIDSSGTVQFYNGIYEQYSAVTSSSNATTVDLQTSTNFSHTLTENTTFTFSNPASSGNVSSFTLKIVQDASASGYTVTWPASVDWPSATAPTLTATASAVDYFVFITHDGGSNWYGFTAGQAFG
jgi:hypothetical protein